MFDIKNIVAESLVGHIGDLNKQQIYEMLECPPNYEMGDVALPCFKLSKVMRQSPDNIAKNLAEKLPAITSVDKIEAVSGYLNFFLNKKEFTEKLLNTVLRGGEKFGSANIGNGKSIVIDFSAPNIAKPFHIGHLRSTVIGNSLYKIHRFMGYECIGVNHLGDWGTQFGKLIVAYKKWGDKSKIEKGQIKELMDLYVKFHEEAEKDSELDEEARNWFTRMENGDEEALSLWKWFKEISLNEFQKVYDLLEVTFDSYAGESFYNNMMKATVEELEEKGLLIESENAQIVDLEEYGYPPCIILKKDGSSLYATRDLTAAIYRKKKYNFEKCIYVTGAAQTLHFNQWFKVIELMGYKWSKDLIHVPFGLVSIQGEKLSTRKGKVILLEDILSEAIKKTTEIIEAKNPDLADKEEVARQIGVGAVVFGDLSNNRIKDISFSWEELLNFDGETGPYVQYSHARTCSLLSKANREVDLDFRCELVNSKEEYKLVKTIYDFPGKIADAMNELEPSVITRYLVDLAQDFNRFYHEHSILVDDNELKNARLAIVKATGIVLSNGLSLLGIHAPERV
ncbi:MAG: arginine--tRNA ligase [Clostridia bacterium]|jgi:arginyl-tRNA synthetase